LRSRRRAAKGREVEENKIPLTHGKDVERISRSDGTGTSDQQRIE
jgi:hypothetical protein